MAFHPGRLYALDRKGIILVSNDVVNTAPAARRRFGSFPPISLFIRSKIVLDRTPYRAFRLDSKIYPEEYLVESCRELLLVQRCRSGGHCELGKVNFKVYKILEEEVGSEERKLVPINDMGDKMLLMGKGCSRLGFRILPQKLHLLLFHYRGCGEIPSSGRCRQCIALLQVS